MFPLSFPLDYRVPICYKGSMTALIKISDSSIITAFDAATIGTKVIDKSGYRAALAKAVTDFEFPENGQAFITFPESAHAFVSAGVAKLDPLCDEALFVKTWRGQRHICAPRSVAAPVEALHAVVYTLNAYKNDPDAEGDTDEARTMRKQIDAFDRDGVTHVLVAVLAFAGPKAPFSPHALLHNIAGGNNEFLPKTNAAADAVLLHKIIGHAKDTLDYARDWVLVADR